MKLELKLDNMILDLIFFNRIPSPTSDEILCIYPKNNSKLKIIWDYLCDMKIKTINGNYFLSIFGFQQKPEEHDIIMDYNQVNIDIKNRYLIFDLESVNITEEDLFYIKLKYS